MQNKTKKGFSILEVMIAGFVLSIGLTATTALVINTLTNTKETRSQIIASELAQEGVELVRNLWDTDITTVTTGTNCNIDYFAGVLVCDGSYDLFIDSYGFYSTDDSGTVTNLERKVEIEDITNGKEIKVFVTWEGSVSDKNIANCTDSNHCVYNSTQLKEWR